jgi:hypothetical protein
MGYVRSLDQTLSNGAWHGDGAPTARRIADQPAANGWPLGAPPQLG